MYNTMHEVVEAVKAKYQGVKLLSRGADHGCYSHRVNGVGCAIGCLVSEEEADILDSGRLNSIKFVMEDDERAPILLRRMSSGITIDELIYLQRAHDCSDTVAQFIEQLDYYLAHGRWAEGEQS